MVGNDPEAVKVSPLLTGISENAAVPYKVFNSINFCGKSRVLCMICFLSDTKPTNHLLFILLHFLSQFFLNLAELDCSLTMTNLF